jgi:HTH-type transcriptional regulator/antitoxin HigA
VQNLARHQRVGEFSRRRFEADCIQALLAESESLHDVSRVPSLLAEYGIRLVILRHLPKTYLDGAAFTMRRRPVIALTLRHDRIDSFWFTLMHELAHIHEGHKGTFLDDLDAERVDDQEQKANRIAAKWLVPPRRLRQFMRDTRPFYARAAIERFAREIGRHPGVVLGRLQRDGEVPYANLRRLLEKVSPELEGIIRE